ncbi:MAG: type II 3-dehydroquinate dehydratase [Desulfobacterales bacterium]|nr:type II 3-dehydroquinate dehydratase [Desulfobacterales bacterium]
MDIETEDAVDVTPTVTLARLYKKQGFLDNAAAVYKRLIALEPSRTDLREALKDIERRLENQSEQLREDDATTILDRLRKWQSAIYARKRMLDQRYEGGGKVLVIHGSDLDLSGGLTVEQIDREITKTAQEYGMTADTFQTDDEVKLAKKISEATSGYDALIINPAGDTCTGAAIREALLTLDIPIIEVHLSNIYRQEPILQESPIADVATAHLAGFGKEGYILAVRAAADMFCSDSGVGYGA